MLAGRPVRLDRTGPERWWHDAAGEATYGDGPRGPAARRRTAVSGDLDGEQPGGEQPDEEQDSLPPLVLRVAAVGALVGPQALLLAVQGVAPLLLREAPLLLLALHPFGPWSYLVSTRTGLVPFLVVVVVVRAVPCVGDYFVGRWYGPRALSWLSRRPRAGRAARTVQRLSARFGSALLLVYPGATSSVLAGVNAVPLRRFLPLMSTGIVLSGVLTRLLASAAAAPLTAAAAFLDRWAVPAGLVLLALVVLSQLRPVRRAQD